LFSSAAATEVEGSAGDDLSSRWVFFRKYLPCLPRPRPPRETLELILLLLLITGWLALEGAAAAASADDDEGTPSDEDL
jgi:hypothetical protein